MRATDGSLATYLDEWQYRMEMMEMVAGGREEEGREEAEGRESRAMETDGHPPSSKAAATAEARAQERGLSPGALQPTLLRALGVLRWLEVYRFYAPDHGLPARTRLAIARLTVCTDELYYACSYGPGANGGPSPPPDWEFLSSDAARTRHSWLVAALLFLFARLPAGPAEKPLPGAAAAKPNPKA